ncbi:Uncharacterised protein [uncultured archaeon]|nr:Uncharacterised protein [uncultured archaeon]
MENPVFLFKVQKADAEAKVSSLFVSKRWEKPEINSSLSCIPCFFFSFDIHDSSSGKTIVVKRGFGALNANSKELEDRLASLSENEEDFERADINQVHEHEMSFLKQRISGGEAKEILPVLLAAKYGALKENVIVSGLDFCNVPFWNITAKYGVGISSKIEINGLTGEVFGSGSIPLRQKTERELVSEVLDELSRPSAWLDYSARILSKFLAPAAPENGGAGQKGNGGGKRDVKGRGKENEKWHGKGSEKGHSKGRGVVKSGNGSASFPSVLPGDDSIYSETARVILLAIIALLAVIWFFLLR